MICKPCQKSETSGIGQEALLKIFHRSAFFTALTNKTKAENRENDTKENEGKGARGATVHEGFDRLDVGIPVRLRWWGKMLAEAIIIYAAKEVAIVFSKNSEEVFVFELLDASYFQLTKGDLARIQVNGSDFGSINDVVKDVVQSRCNSQDVVLPSKIEYLPLNPRIFPRYIVHVCFAKEREKQLVTEKEEYFHYRSKKRQYDAANEVAREAHGAW
mmetsp:Transcript_24465/g.61931  ORF Transcript_24465/g.61931 Transcript_24465/m.61931 type:complete len:216 (+) Transcript_24465:3676-4323(+)